MGMGNHARALRRSFQRQPGRYLARWAVVLAVPLLASLQFSLLQRSTTPATAAARTKQPTSPSAATSSFFLPSEVAETSVLSSAQPALGFKPEKQRTTAEKPSTLESVSEPVEAPVDEISDAGAQAQPEEIEASEEDAGVAGAVGNVVDAAPELPSAR